MKLDGNRNNYVGGETKHELEEIEIGRQKSKRLILHLEHSGRASLAKKMATIWNNTHGIYTLHDAVLTQI